MIDGSLPVVIEPEVETPDPTPDVIEAPTEPDPIPDTTEEIDDPVFDPDAGPVVTETDPRLNPDEESSSVVPEVNSLYLVAIGLTVLFLRKRQRIMESV